MAEEPLSDEEVDQQLQAYVVEQIKAGRGKPEITTGLQDLGMEPDQAAQLTRAMYDGIVDTARAEAFTPIALIMAGVGALLAAIVGGAVWGGIVILTNYEVGIVAWGIGFLSGIAVVMFARGPKGLPFQVVAVISSVLGIALGKYLTFYHFLKEYVIEEYGAEVVAGMSMVSDEMIALFIESLPEIVSGFDLLWVVLAVITAWRIPASMGIKLRS